MSNREKHDRMANAIRFLSMDAVEKANSGHPGLPMGCADIATVLFTRFLKYDPKNPHWADRDRFVLSAGHGSMLLYSVLYLTGYEDITIDEIKQFRQLGSRTAGHPEYGHAAGIETTTGPLGQGLANSVGMALAERILNATFGDDLVDHFTYTLVGDGCLMEGISQEALSLAGHLKLNKLIVIWDNNSISIDGPVSLADSTDQLERFEASGWNTMACDGHDPDAIAACLERARASDRPTLIAAKTTIGFGAPHKAGTNKAHGSPLGAEEIAGARKTLGWDYKPFEVPSDILDAWRLAGLNSARKRKDWEKRLDAADADIRAEFERRMRGRLPQEARRRQAQGRDPQIVGNGAGGHQRRRPRDDRRLGRPDRLQQHQDQRDRADLARQVWRPLHSLRHPRARHGRGHERHGPARRGDPLRRHLHGVLGLQPAVDPAGGPDGDSGHPCADP